MIQAIIDFNGFKYAADLSKPLDISIPMSANGPRAWHEDAMRIEPVVNDYFTGSVALGGPVNFRNVFFNPHAHGTHTEGVGHISKEDISVLQALQQHFFVARVMTIQPKKPAAPHSPDQENDRVIRGEDVEVLLSETPTAALVIRTLPNGENKKTMNYSGTNFCYVEPDAMRLMVQAGVQHLLIDQPSVDREQDGGLLQAHHIFWQYPQQSRQMATITEFVFVPDAVPDGLYLLNLQTAALVNDATPSRPVLYALNKL